MGRVRPGGKRYYLIKSGGLWWADKSFHFGRYPDWPNHNELWRGLITSDIEDGGKVYTDGSGYLREKTNKVLRSPYDSKIPEGNSWSAWNEQADPPEEAELLAYDADGNLKRLTITSNNGNTLFFGGLTAIPTPEEEAALVVDYVFGQQRFTIVPAGSRGWPERRPWRTDWWYGGAQEHVYTHDPSDTLAVRTLAFAADSVEWEESEDTTLVACGSPESIHTEYDALDKDVWTSITNQCSPADHCFSPHLFKSNRWLQTEIIAMIGSCVRPIDYSGKKEIPSYSIAQCFADCDINNGTGTVAVTSVTGPPAVHTYHFTVAAAYKGWPVYWEAVKDGLRKATGFTASDVTTGKVVVAVTSTTDAQWLGATIVYSAGLTRWHRREIGNIYERGGFVPDVKVDELGGRTVIFPAAVDDFCGDPPSPCANDCFGMGQWVWRGVSRGYKTYGAHGYAADGENDFVVGEAVRYVGDGWLDPGTGVTREAEDDIEDLPYWDRFYEGQHPKIKQQQLRMQRTGIVTGATKLSVTDTSKNWYENWYAEGGTMRVETGIATGGSTTTLVTSADLTNATLEANCAWQVSRFNGSIFVKDAVTKPYLSFILEIDKAEVDANNQPITRTYKVPIIDVTANTPGNAPILHFTSILNYDGDALTAEAADVWRIVEPATTIHRWRGKRVKLSRPDGTILELDITHNDKDTLFFEAQTAAENIPAVGWGIEIVEHETGGIWLTQTTVPTTEQKTRRWHKLVYQIPDPANAGEFLTKTWYLVQPTGTDTRATASAEWHGPTHTNMTENLANLHPKMYGVQQKGDSIGIHLYDEVYKLLNRLVWTKTTPSWTSNAESSRKFVFEDGIIPATWNDILVHTNNAWSSAPNFEDGGSASPAAIASATSGGDTGSSDVSRIYAYGTLGGIPNLIAHAIDFYNYADSPLPVGTSHPNFDPGHYVSEFNAQGDAVAYQQWTKWHTMSAAKTATRQTTAPLGTHSTPPWASTLPDEGDAVSASSFSSGYIISATQGVLKWNVAGGAGLRYVDWTA